MNDTPLQLYTKIQELVKKDAREQATKVYNDLGTKFGVASIPTHVHDGTDAVQLSDVNSVSGDRHVCLLTLGNPDVVSATGTFTLLGLNVSNMKRIVLYGFGANNADGSPATKRAIINGEAQFGRCYAFTTPSFNLPGVTVLGNTDSVPGVPFTQVCNSMYIDSTTLANNKVFTGNELAGAIDPAYAGPPNPPNLIDLEIISSTYNSITFSYTLEANWQLQAHIIVS